MAQQAMQQPETRARLIGAAIDMVRARGYTATRVDDVCAEAGVSKGSFFHHFRSKDDLALAAMEQWQAGSGRLFSGAPYHRSPDPLDRVLGYLAFRKSLLRGKVPEYTCLAGTMVQEMYDTSPEIRAACERSLLAHARTLEADIAEAMRAHGVAGGAAAARSLALHIQCVVQGGFIFAKATESAEIARDGIDHLCRYIALMFGKRRKKKTPRRAKH